jgi:stage II sporulation protein AA (anti-sigma F factor antagonist)
MKVIFDYQEPVVVGHIHGRIDSSNSHEFRQTVHQQLEQVPNSCRQVVLEFSQTEYLSSAGFRELFLIGRHAGSKNMGLSFCQIPPALGEVFNIAQMSEAYAIYPTVQSALNEIHPTSTNLRVKFIRDDAKQTMICRVSGRIDSANYAEFSALMQTELETAPQHLILDLSGLEYLNSAGFRELFLAGRRQSKIKGTFSVCGLQPPVKDLFDLAQFGVAYPIYPDREEALKNIIKRVE